MKVSLINFFLFICVHLFAKQIPSLQFGTTPDYIFPDWITSSFIYESQEELEDSDQLGPDYPDNQSDSLEIIDAEPFVPIDTDLIDLELLRQDFVLETKRIVIPKCPDAFNPSIIRWNDRLLMCFRTYHPETRSTNEIAFVYLDKNFETVGVPRFLRFRTKDPSCLFKRQDPRLVQVNNRLFIVYNNAVQGELRRMLVAELYVKGDCFFADQAECLYYFEGESRARSEKNWVPFDYNGDLYLGYSIVPHKILQPIFGMSKCRTVASSLPAIKWDWGVLRGGSPALLEGEEYLAFFHSSKSMATKHSSGRNIPHYFMGAYTFSSKPPFKITRVSPEPIVGKHFYNGPAYKTWKPLRVVFPGGYVADEKYIWVVYGRQDHEVWVAKLDKKGLLESLVPVTQKL